jgi:glutaconyl-CoA/methylmalonyl-CoA decarboxylase subunit gamma
MKLRITLDGVTYDLDVEFLDETQAATQPLPAAPAPRPVVASAGSAKPVAAPPVTPPPGAATDKTVLSPLSGTVFKLLVKVGDSVQLNQELLVLEAMKMETNIVAAGAGVIKNVAVAEGQAVRQGQLLIEFE